MKLQGEVYKIKEGLWQAIIHNGWYVGVGKTKQAAIKQCEDRYRKEQEKLNG